MSKRPKQSRRREGLRRKKKRALTPRRMSLGELSLWLLIAAAGGILLLGGWPGFPWSESEEARVKGLVTVIVAALLLGDLLHGEPRLAGRASWRTIVAALLAVAAYLNFAFTWTVAPLRARARRLTTASVISAPSR